MKRHVVCVIRHLLSHKHVKKSFLVPVGVPVKDYLYNKYGLKGCIITDYYWD